MAQVGKTNKLRVVKQVDFGFYLDGGELGEILIPNRYFPENSDVDDFIEVFIYLDSEDRLIATTEKPFVEVGGCAHLEVIQSGQFGVFMNWGLPKDLLAPFKEQRIPMQIGKYYTVYLYVDVTGRIAASSKLSTFLKEENEGAFVSGQAVDLLVATRSDIGYKAVINNTHLGIIHTNEILQPIDVGDKFTGYIKGIRPDGRINLTTQPKGEDLRDPLCKAILDYLEAQGGTSHLTDTSPPEQIYETFNVSKSNYKKALGKLYKEKRILIENDQLTLM
jgi:uncharacterized protein